MKTSWFAVTLVPVTSEDLSGDELDSLCLELLELGAKGTAVDTHPEIVCYIEGSDRDAAATFVESIGTLDERFPRLSVISINPLRDENWTGACPEVWQTVQAGHLIIAPIESVNDARLTPPNAIRIIPGLGFGTGHHATTKMVLEELSELYDHIKERSVINSSERFPTKIFDLGTGSGILAIAAAKLFNVPVDANEVDAGALDNAQDNVNINDANNLVSLSLTPIEDISSNYDIILANLYGEVLIRLAPDIARISRPGTYAILSGITELVWEQVLNAFNAQATWRVVKERSENSWSCAVLLRQP
jgi:ribosomal protein L11 methyltransferase